MSSAVPELHQARKVESERIQMWLPLLPLELVLRVYFDVRPTDIQEQQEG
jgi:hypothetical protein